MARGDRNAKRLAQRIDLSYLTKPHWFRRWRFWLSIAAPLVALVWVATLAGRERAFSAGPLSDAHAVLGDRCELCHTKSFGIFRETVKDNSCLACHAGPAHQANQTFTPACATCHAEHTGAPRLVRIADAHCGQCHTHLKVAGGQPKFARTVASFNSNHPEFAALKQPNDPGGIKLNHVVHLKKDLRGPRGPVQLVCADCHRSATGTRDAWPYGQAQFRQAAAPAEVGAHRVEEPYMAPPTYAQACAACHALRFDARIAAEVPHEKPEAVRAFVEQELRKYIAQNPADIRNPVGPPRRLPDSPPPVIARNADEWVALQMRGAETLLWRKTCAECHTLNLTGGAPQVQPAKIPAVWMPHARFSHPTHRLLTCESCHAVGESRETRDVLLPAINTCQQCHHGGAVAADNRCATCHTYHEWRAATPTPAKFNLDEVLGRAK